MSIVVRKWLTVVEQTERDGGRPAPEGAPPLVKAAAVAIISNPYAGRYAEDLGQLVEFSGGLAQKLVARGLAALGGPAESCGKAAIIGIAGEQEHGVACLGTPVGDAIRGGIDGNTWVSSTTKVAAPGASIDVPLAYKRALFVRSHYDTITVTLPDGPRPDEIAVILAFASRGRLHHRVGGLAKEDATKGDGLR
jgi:hypothetical protein